MKIVIDLDWTICELRKEWQDYSDVRVNKNAVEKIQKFKEEWHYIIIQTARHMETCWGNVWLVQARVWKKTIDWLEEHNIPYDEIFFGKPNWDLYLDDNAKVFTTWEDTSDIQKYNNKNINIVIPMAWAGSRFTNAWYTNPKPLIEVKGKTMVEWAVSSFDFLKQDYNLNYIFVVLKDHIENYQVDKFLEKTYKNCKIIVLDEITRWQAETVLKAKEHIDTYDKLIVYNADTYSDYSLEDFPINNNKVDGIITCFEDNDPRYSYAKLDEYWYVEQVAEKVAISGNATNGLYYFRRWIDFVNYAELMIGRNELSNWEFYVWPMYNYLIDAWKRIKIAPVKENWVIGTPEELEYFLNNYK